MQIKYKNKDLEEKCTNLNKAKVSYPDKIARKLIKTINFITVAESLHDIIHYRPFNFHTLKGDRKKQHAIDIDGRSSGYRLIVKMENEGIADIYVHAKEIKILLVWEVSNHYE